MKPLETFPVHLLFAPTKVKGADAKLQIRVSNSTAKYTVRSSYQIYTWCHPIKILFHKTTRVAVIFVTSLVVQIPLNGYGGISKLVLENVEKGQNNNYWKNIGTPRTSVTSLVKASVRNIGHRAAYVKCLGFMGELLLHYYL